MKPSLVITTTMIVATLTVRTFAQQPELEQLISSAAEAGRKGDHLKAIRDLTSASKLNPKLPQIWQRRGEEYFRSGKITESISDFDRYLALVPDQKPFHWQRGISLYYAGRFKDGKEQFELHQTVNTQDVENAVWHYLCTARAMGVEAAKKQLIPIQSDSRVPMAQVHQLFAGKCSPQDVLDAAQKASVINNGAEPMFYANLYLGLYHEAVGDNDKARSFILKAAERADQNGYMGDVARVHANIIKSGSKAKPIQKQF